MDIEKFEKFLLNKRQFISDMRSINKEEIVDYTYSVQLEILDDIIHHFNVFVKDKMSDAFGDNP